MPVKTLIRSAFALSLYFLLGMSAAWGSTLTGTIYAGSSVLSGASVVLVDTATSSTAGSVTTNGDGRYSFAVSAGTYNLLVTPPTSVSLLSSRVNGIEVGAQDLNQDVVMVLSDTIWTGVVYEFQDVL